MNRYEDLPALMTMMTGDEKHSPSATSTLDVLWTLYDRVLRTTPETVEAPDRDRFLMSKGHGPMALYAVLAAKGFIPWEWLADFGRFESPLGHHPDRNLVPGVEIASGSLGHGLPIALGVALALDACAAASPRVFVLLGDAELDEGSNHEAIALAGRMRLDRLTAIVVDNASATHGWPGGIEARFAIEGWETAVVNGRDHAALASAFAARSPGRPRVVVCHAQPKEG
ncbi:MAG: thiamine pyrophosphate-dependent enzyme [Immundisolibacterales bacterium]|nr:thiamine pyrophosphate-dependent enzyme [Immundisolibacterales bacterium]